MIHQRFVLLIFILCPGMLQVCGQIEKNVMRVEFNMGSRTYREQIIITPDSILIVKEDFTKDNKPDVRSRTNTRTDWNKLIGKLQGASLQEIGKLKSPTDKRTYDGASQGSLIITTNDNQTYSHSFDDDNPHEKLKPMMDHISSLKRH